MKVWQLKEVQMMNFERQKIDFYTNKKKKF